MRFINSLTGLTLCLLITAGSAFSAETTVTHESHSTNTPKAPLALDVLFGGPFELQDHLGQTRRDSDWSGQFKLVFFGYTNCPAICPTTLQDITDALDILGEDAKSIQPLFITVDPERDTVEVLNEYVTSFHPSLVGLTGSETQISKVAKSYRVQRHKILLSEEDHSAHNGQSNGASKGGVNYDAAHSTLTYLMDPSGKFITLFPYDTRGEVMAKRLQGYIRGSS